MSKKRRNPDRGRESEHSIPRVAVQVVDIGYGIPGIQWFCNNPAHTGCIERLERAFKEGGFVVRSSYWFQKYEQIKKAREEVRNNQH